MITTFPDPFAETDERWQPYRLPSEQPELGGLDNPATGLLAFLREEEKARAERQPKPQPQSASLLGHIPGFQFGSLLKPRAWLS